MQIEPGALFEVKVPVTLCSLDFSHYVFPGGSLVMFIDVLQQEKQVTVSRMLTKRGILYMFNLHACDDYYLSMVTQ
jgi:hypothetical protein